MTVGRERNVRGRVPVSLNVPTTTILQELRQALRRLAKAPGFTALAVLTLALGIGSNVAIFSLVDVLFLRPLQLPDADRLVGVYETREGTGFFPLSLPDARDHRDRTTVFADLAAHYPSAPLSVRTDEGLEEVNGSLVSANYFSVLGVEPARGRFFLPEEDAVSGGSPVAVVSHGLWQTRLAGRDDAIGETLELNGTAFTVVGVAPQGFEGVRLGLPSEVWIPTGMAHVGYRWCDTSDRDCTFLNLIGRLAPGHTLAEAQTEMTLLGRRVRAAHPSGGEDVRGLTAAPLDAVHPGQRASLLRLSGLLLAAVTLLVLVAGANLAGLLVGRGLACRQEIAVRLAIGASRRRVVSLFLAETLLLSIAGGAAGLLLAAGLGRIVALFFPSSVPIDLGISPAVLGYTALLSVLTGLAVGFVPGLQAARPSLVPALKDPVSMGIRGRPKVLGLLVVAQVALSLILLTGTGLLIRSLETTTRFGSLDAQSVATLRLRPRLVGYTPQQARAFTREVVRRIEALPGVRSVSLARGIAHLPFGTPGTVGRAGDTRPGPTAWFDAVTSGFLETNGIELLRGRDFDGRDHPASPPVVLVNQTLARTLWPGGEAVGQRLAIGEDTFEVVGVMGDALYRNAAEHRAPQVYKAYWQNPQQIDARLAVRASGDTADAAELLPMLRRTIFEIDSRVPVTETETLRDRLRSEFAAVHLAGRVLGAAGGVALLLSAVGLFGVLALAVTQRRREIGIRMALGGRRAQVVGTILRDGLTLVALALGLGLVTALPVNRALAHYLYGVSPYDLSVFAAALAVLALTATLACWWPARRAARVDPMMVLRQS